MMYRLYLLFAICCAMATSQAVYAHNNQQAPQEQKKNDKEDPEPNIDGVVEVSFKIDQAGKVEIINMNSTSPQLAEYVIKKLSKVQLQQGGSQIGKVIRYRFVFKKQA
ncbi:MAG: hypothetical protein ACKVOR_10695 [Flavobacteriales bacterium]